MPLLVLPGKFFVRNPSKYLQIKCGTKEFRRFEKEFQHFDIEFCRFENELHQFQIKFQHSQMLLYEFLTLLHSPLLGCFCCILKLGVQFQNDQFLDLRKNAGNSSFRRKKNEFQGEKNRVSGFSAKSSFTQNVQKISL